MPFEIFFNDTEHATVYQTEFARFKRDVNNLARIAVEKGVPVSEVQAVFFTTNSNGRDFITAEIRMTDSRGGELISVKREIDIERRILTHEEMVIRYKPARGKGLAGDILKVSKGLVESFNSSTILVNAAMENGAYAWLRYGYFPTDPTDLDDIFLRAEDTTLTQRQVRRWLNLSEAEKREFVKSDQFRDYKEALKNKRWQGGAFVETAEQRALLFGPVEESDPARTVRNAKAATTANDAKQRVAESKAVRAINRNRIVKETARRGIGVPAFAQLTDRFIAYGVDVSALSENLRASISEIYERIELELIDALRKIDPASATRPRARQLRLEALLKQTQIILSDGIETIRNFTLTDLRELAAFEASFTASSINAVVGVEVASTAITPAAINTILGETLINGAPSAEWWSRQDMKVRNAFADSVRVGLLQGETTEQIVSRIQGSYTGRRVPYRTRAGRLRFKSEYAGGLLQATRRETQALTRTSIATVANKVREDTIKDNSDVTKGSQFLATLDGRTTPICQFHSQLVWDNQNNPVGHSEPYPGSPPLHWNCRSTLVPVLKKWSELSNSTRTDITAKIDERESLRRTTQASANGQVRADLTYEDWLRTQSAGRQETILGSRRFRLWQDGEINISAPRGT